jgi:hypothetical protein
VITFENIYISVPYCQIKALQELNLAGNSQIFWVKRPIILKKWPNYAVEHMVNGKVERDAINYNYYGFKTVGNFFGMMNSVYWIKAFRRVRFKKA